jgi:peptidoglycan/xylan/chitin deacetylase (PgdA/CDA1 family)
VASALVRGAAGRVAASPGLALFVTVLEHLVPQRLGALAVLTYHRVDEEEARPELYPGLISAAPAEFAAQMRHIAARRSIVSLDDVLAARAGDRLLPPDAVLITFDDAYADFEEHAWPVLRSLGLPVTLFVPTAFPGDPELTFWWDRLWNAIRTAAVVEVATRVGLLPLRNDHERLRAYLRLRDHVKALPHDAALAVVEELEAALASPPSASAVLDWSRLRRLAREGVTLAPHTRTHPLLNRVPAEQARAEVAGSFADLRREVGAAAPAFAYPAGGYAPAAEEALREEGCAVAFTTARGVNAVAGGEWLRLRRINVGRRSTLPVLRAQLLRRPVVGAPHSEAGLP